MFAGVVDENAWPKVGLTTERWKQVPPFWVDINMLWATQDGIHLEPLIRMASLGAGYKSYCGDTFPHVIAWKNKLYLEDGHHRVVKRMLDGKTNVYARVFTILD